MRSCWGQPQPRWRGCAVTIAGKPSCAAPQRAICATTALSALPAMREAAKEHALHFSINIDPLTMM